MQKDSIGPIHRDLKYFYNILTVFDVRYCSDNLKNNAFNYLATQCQHLGLSLWRYFVWSSQQLGLQIQSMLKQMCSQKSSDSGQFSAAELH